MCVGLDADRLEPEPVDARTPSGGDEKPVTAQLTTILGVQDVVLAIPTRSRRVRAERQFDPVAEQDLAERLAQRCGLMR